MNEEQIASQLASSVTDQNARDYSYPDPETENKAPQNESGLDPETPEDPFQKYVTKQEVLRYFEIAADKINGTSEAIDNIIAFAKREVGNDPADIIQYLNNTERQLGSRLMGNRLTKLNQFIVIRNQRRLLEQKEKALYA